MTTVSLSQIFNVSLDDLINTLGINLYPQLTILEINNQLPVIYNEYRKQLILKYFENNKQHQYPQLDNESKKIVENAHFFSSMKPENTTLENIITDMNRQASESTKKHNPEDYYDNTSTLTNDEQKYCRTVLHVAAKQDDWCLEGKHWQEKNPDTKQVCYNPYSVASNVVPRSTRPDCLVDLKLNNLSPNELKAEANLHKMTIAELQAKQNQMRLSRGLPLHIPIKR